MKKLGFALSLLTLMLGRSNTNTVLAASGEELHVYSAEIPWNQFGESYTTYNSITDAINSADPGDTIVVHEGIYRETVDINVSNLTIKAFENDYVLVTGSDLVSGFSPVYNMPGVYYADVAYSYNESEMPYTQVFVNGDEKTMARHPNLTIDDMMAPLELGGGYSKLSNIHKDSGTLVAEVTFEDLPNVNLEGGIFRGLTGKNRNYVIGDVVGSSGDTLMFEGFTANDWRTVNKKIAADYHDYGFGFVTHKNLIDTPGEWFVEDNKVYYMPQYSMDNLEVEMQVRKKVLQMDNVNNISIQDINFTAGNAEMINVDGLTIEGCSFRYLHPFFTTSGYGMGSSSRTGIYMENCDNGVYRDTYVAHSWGNGITLTDESNNNSFYNCIIEDIGWLGIFTAGIYARGDNTRIENCTLNENGRFQIRVETSVKIDILHSEFKGAMQMGEDAGPLEFTSTGHLVPLDLDGSEIAYNKVHDVRGVPVSAGGYNKQFVVGFYMEDTNNYTAHHNLVYDIIADSYDGPEYLQRKGSFLYLGPRFKALTEPVNFYNNTIWNYNNNINIWNIQIANYDNLMAQGAGFKTHTGSMANGNFVNNLFQTGPFSINYAAQNLTKTGGTQSNATISENKWKSIETSDMDKFFDHAAQVGYSFNPETNMMFDRNEDYYVDSANGDFRLTNWSPAKNAGTPIPGITSSNNPDLGALEGSDYVLSAGAMLEIPYFKEIR
ncbi:MAG: hypothetical protein ATN31_11170 [Candidatus Epulonipiscioides saccharophilum]|nr:MAG: hypothetical protein ATN31_11170 [Epulopiscium sp. AS2M-Bin001]